MQCLNDLVTNALNHVEDCLKYMSNLRDLSIFRFCAIPQVWNFFDSSCRISRELAFPLCAYAFVPIKLADLYEPDVVFCSYISFLELLKPEAIFLSILVWSNVFNSINNFIYCRKKPLTFLNHLSSLYVHVSYLTLKQWSFMAQLSI